MKIAVYSIARNEVHEVAGWEETTREADFRLLFDTGSDDGTDTEMEKFSDVSVYRGVVKPWRFDDARNAALALVPADIDICVSLDMDERLRGVGEVNGVGWKQAIIDAWKPDTTMLRCPMNSGGATYYSWRIHKRFGYRWRHPVHEILHWRGETNSTETMTDNLFIDHLPTNEKPRPPHLSMLLEAVAEDPTDARMRLQLGWQLVAEGKKEEGIPELYRYLDLSIKTGLEAAFVHRLIAQNDVPGNFLTHMRSAEAAHLSTSNQIVLAEYYEKNAMWQECYTACQAAIARERMRPAAVGHWGDDSRLRTSWLHDLASRAAWNCWDFEACYGHAVEAFRRNPDESRRKNVLAIEEHIAKGATLENFAPAPPSDAEQEEIGVRVITLRPKLDPDQKRIVDISPVKSGQRSAS